MIKIKSILNFLLVGICFFTSSCSDKKVRQTDKPLHFVFITTCVEEDFFKPVKKGMFDAAALMGVNCSFIGTKDVDVKAQAELVQEAVEKGADGIALNIIDSSLFDVVVKNAMDMGIPVVAFNSDDSKTPNARLSSVCQNFFKAGQLFGEKILECIHENSVVLATIHSVGISALDDRLRGIKDVLKRKNITCKVVITGIKADSASLVVTDALKANPEIRTVLCTGLADTEGTGMAIENNFSDQNIIAAGFDLSSLIVRYIRNGQLIFTVDQQPYMQGFYPVIQIAQYVRYGIIPSSNEIGSSFVTKDNIERVVELIAKGYR